MQKSTANKLKKICTQECYSIANTWQHCVLLKKILKLCTNLGSITGTVNEMDKLVYIKSEKFYGSKNLTKRMKR
jgi:hypothetical protein